jgi:hypothetical protein
MEAASPLSELLAPQVGAIFQDAVDQLAVLGALAPPEEGGSSRGDSGGVLGDEVGSIVQEQRELERKYDAVRLGAVGGFAQEVPMSWRRRRRRRRRAVLLLWGFESVRQRVREIRPVNMCMCASVGENGERERKWACCSLPRQAVYGRQNMPRGLGFLS